MRKVNESEKYPNNCVCAFFAKQPFCLFCIKCFLGVRK